MEGTRVGKIFAGVLLSFGTSAALFTCVVAFLAASAAVGLVLYGTAHLFAHAFDLEFHWGLAIACWLLLVAPPLGALVHDRRLHRKLVPPVSARGS